MGLGQRTDDCPVFYPTLKDMEGGWESYIVGVEKRFARAGICKIIPPAGWKARKGGYDDMDGTNIIIPKAIKQSASGRVSCRADITSISLQHMQGMRLKVSGEGQEQPGAPQASPAGCRLLSMRQRFLCGLEDCTMIMSQMHDPTWMTPCPHSRGNSHLLGLTAVHKAP